MNIVYYGLVLQFDNLRFPGKTRMLPAPLMIDMNVNLASLFDRYLT